MLFSRADIHMHTTCSDGFASPVEVAEILLRSPLAVAAVTDHNRIEGALRVREAMGGRGPEIIIGTEVSSRDGHILALYVEQDIPPRMSALQTVEAIHHQDGLAIAPHPFFPVGSVGWKAGELPFDAVEISNGTPLGEIGNWLARRRLASGARAVVGGSDAHFKGAVGSVQTLFPGTTAADLRAAILLGQTRVNFRWGQHLRAAGPFLAWLARDAVAVCLPGTRARRLEEETLREFGPDRSVGN